MTFRTNRSSAAIAFALLACVALAGEPAAAQTSAVSPTVDPALDQQSTAPPPVECPAHDPEPADGNAPAAAASGGSAEQPPPVVGGRTPSHMYGVLPNYATVEDPNDATPIPTRLKFKLAALNTFDPYVYPFVGAVAAMNRDFGSDAAGYLHQYVVSLADNSIGNMLTSAALPSLLHQDPRYFERGSGSVLSRLAYAASRSVITRSDSGNAQFNVSEIGGNAIAAGLSNLYYPSGERTVTETLTRWGMQVMWDTLSNELKEFWPDVRRKLHGQ